MDGDGDNEAKKKIKCFHHGQSIQDVVECLPKMLACETYPRVPKKYPDLDGGHHKVGFSFGDMEFAGSDLLGSYHRERGVGFESCVVRKGLGELIEVSVDDREVRVDYDNRISAIYDRKLGVLNCASFSLAREMKKLSRAGSDIIVVVNFDDDGSERAFLILSDSQKVCRPLAGARMTNVVGELLRTWHCISPIGGIDFCVGLRVFVLDFVVVNPNTGEGTPYHVAQELDFSLLDRERISPGLALRLAQAAFPGLDE